MKQWFLIFSAIVAAGIALVSWQRWVARWDGQSVALMQSMANRITAAQDSRYRLPDPQAVDHLGAENYLLEEVYRRAQSHLFDAPPGATMEGELKKALDAAGSELGRNRAELDKPGNRFAAGR